jgi:hypothetical protein
LHRIKMLRLQKSLLEEALEFKYEKPRRSRRRDFNGSTTLHKYSKPIEYLCQIVVSLTCQIAEALSDWEYIKACASKGRMKDPYILTTERTRDFTLLKEAAKSFREEPLDRPWARDGFLISKLDDDIRSLGTLPEPRDKGQPELLFGGSRRGFFDWSYAHHGVEEKLAVNVAHNFSLCRGFGFVLALYLDKPFDVLSGTAAYAAVLVVFVGTSTT